MATRGAILFDKENAMGFYKHNDMYIDGFLKKFIKSIKELNSRIFFENVEYNFMNFISYDAVNEIRKAVQIFNDDVNDVLNEMYYYGTDIRMEYGMEHENITYYDVEYEYIFTKEDIQVYTIPIGATEDYYVGAIKYDWINEKSIEDLNKMIVKLVKHDDEIRERYYSNE